MSLSLEIRRAQFEFLKSLIRLAAVVALGNLTTKSQVMKKRNLTLSDNS